MQKLAVSFPVPKAFLAQIQEWVIPIVAARMLHENHQLTKNIKEYFATGQQYQIPKILEQYNELGKIAKATNPNQSIQINFPVLINLNLKITFNDDLYDVDLLDNGDLTQYHDLEWEEIQTVAKTLQTTVIQRLAAAEYAPDQINLARTQKNNLAIAEEYLFQFTSNPDPNQKAVKQTFPLPAKYTPFAHLIDNQVFKFQIIIVEHPADIQQAAKNYSDDNWEALFHQNKIYIRLNPDHLQAAASTKHEVEKYLNATMHNVEHELMHFFQDNFPIEDRFGLPKQKLRDQKYHTSGVPKDPKQTEWQHHSLRDAEFYPMLQSSFHKLETGWNYLTSILDNTPLLAKIKPLYFQHFVGQGSMEAVYRLAKEVYQQVFRVDANTARIALTKIIKADPQIFSPANFITNLKELHPAKYQAAVKGLYKMFFNETPPEKL